MSAPTWLVHAVPISIAATPATASDPLPSRRLSREVTLAAAKAAAVTGRKARPASSGV